MKVNIDFIGKRKIWYAISLTVIIVGMIFFFVRGMNYGIDFTGGSLMSVKFDKTGVTSEQVRNVLAGNKQENASIQESTDGTFTIKVKELDEDTQANIMKSFNEKIGAATLQRAENVGPVIGSELKKNALWALLIASILQVIYITIRFEFKSGIAAILSLLHDVFIMVGFFAVFRIEADSTFIAAVLTIIGYSIMDTIVIFDRIRENMRNRKKEDLGQIINNSINQTLARSINTVLTVIFVLIALLLLGGETTKNMALGLLVGVVSGCYSSICVASPLWYEFKPEDRRSKAKAKIAKAKV